MHSQANMATSQTYKKKKRGGHSNTQHNQWSLRDAFNKKQTKNKQSPMNGHQYYPGMPMMQNNNSNSQASLSASDLIKGNSKGRLGSARFGRRSKNRGGNDNDEHSNNNSRNNSSNNLGRPDLHHQGSYSGGGGGNQGGYGRPLTPSKPYHGMSGRKFTQMDPTNLTLDQIKMIQMELERLSLERTQLETENLLRQKQVHQMEESLESTAQQTAMVAYQASQQRQRVIELERALKLRNKQLAYHQNRKSDMRPTNFLTILPIQLRKKFGDFLKKVLFQQRPAFEKALLHFMKNKVSDKELPANCTRDQLMQEIANLNNSLIDDYVNELELRLNGTFSEATDPSVTGGNGGPPHHRTQESTSDTENSFVVHHSLQPSGSAGVNNYKTPQNLSIQPGNLLNITDKSEEEDISALSKDPNNNLLEEDVDPSEEDYDSSPDARKDSTPGSTKMNKNNKHNKSGKSEKNGNGKNARKQDKLLGVGNMQQQGMRGGMGMGARGSNRVSPNARGDGGDESTDSDSDENELDFENDPEAFAMQQQMANMWETQLTKMSSVGGGGSDGMQQLLESFMQMNHDLNMERPETAPDMFGVPKELRERPYLELRDLLEALPYNLSIAILREQEHNYPNDKIKDIMIQRGCWPMVRFQTGKGKIISVNINRTVPFSDVLTKLETYLGLNKEAVDLKYTGNALLGTFDPQHTTGFRFHMITGVIRQRSEAKHEITALNLRIGRLWSVSERSFEMLSNAVDFYQSLDKPSLMLVLGPNTAEKSSLIREITRMTANNYNIRTALVDTRSSVGGYTNSPLECGQAVRYYVNAISNQCHVIDETRSIYPQCVIVDEILSEEDINALQKLQSEGISVVCGTNQSTLQALMSHTVFSKLLPPQDRPGFSNNNKKHVNSISFMSAHLVILQLNYSATKLKVYKNVPAACKAVIKNLSPPCDTYPIEWMSYNQNKYSLTKVAHTKSKHDRSNSRAINKLIKKSYRNIYHEDH